MEQTNLPHPTDPVSPSVNIPSKATNKLPIIIGVIILLIIVVGIASALFPQMNKQKPVQKSSQPVTKSLSPTIIELSSTGETGQFFQSTSGKIAPKNSLLYAKEVQELNGNSRGWPVYTVFAADIHGKQKTPLFTIGGINNFPIELKFLKQRNAILINLEHSLLLYDLQTGKISDVYTGKSNEGYILGGALSHDGKYLLFNYSTDYVNPNGPENRLILVNLDDKSQKEIFSGKPNFSFRGYFVPDFWLPDDSKIYLGGTVPSDGPFGYAVINKDGSNFHSIPEMNTNGKYSPAGNYFAYVSLNSDELNSIKWACYSSPNTMLTLVDTVKEQQTLVEKNVLNNYTVRGWSPDNKQLVYDVRKYKSGEGCQATFYPVESYVYDIATKTSTKVSSADQQLVTWGVEPAIITINSGTNDPHDLSTINADAVVIDKATNSSSIGLLYLGYYQ